MRIDFKTSDAKVVSESDRLVMAYDMLTELLSTHGSRSFSSRTGDALVIVDRDELGTITVTDATVNRSAFLHPDRR